MEYLASMVVTATRTDVQDGVTEVADGVAIQSISGRGRGLVAQRAFAKGERIFAASAFGYALDVGRSRDELECCAVCLCFGERLSIRCTGCPAVYCSEACEYADQLAGHGYCCGPLARLASVGARKATISCKSTAAFLVRAFALRRAQAAHGDALTEAQQASSRRRGVLAPPSFEDALSQCLDFQDDMDSDGSFFAEREAQRERAVDLAVKQAGRLVKPRADAMALLRTEPHNSFTLRDPAGRARGWVMYPHVSYINHSCVPCAATVADGRASVVEALRDVPRGEELTICYLRIGADDDDGKGTSGWGFDCQCARCDKSAPQETLDAFDHCHQCACGCITTPYMLQHMGDMAGGKTCVCHAHNHVPSPWPAIPRELEQSRREVELPSGETMVITSFQRARPWSASRAEAETVAIPDGGGAPAAAMVTLSPPSRTRAEADYELLHHVAHDALPCGQRIEFGVYSSGGGGGGSTSSSSFCAQGYWGARPPIDEHEAAAAACATGLSSSRRAELLTFLRSRLLEPWCALSPELDRLCGTLEVLHEGIGANMEWHRNGHAPGYFIAQFHLPGSPLTEGMTEEAAMDWFEVALPPTPEIDSTNNHSEGAAAKAPCTPANFLAFSFAAGPRQPLVIFEDSSCYHRTPLTALAVHDLQARRRRPVVRIIFRGLDAEGGPVGFPHHPPSAAAGHDLEPEPYEALARTPQMMLPLGLCRLFEQYTAEVNHSSRAAPIVDLNQDDGSEDKEGAAEEGHPRQMSLDQAFADYVDGSDARLMQFVRSKATAGGRRATLCPRYHAIESIGVGPYSVCR